MAAPASYTFSKPVELHEDKLFATDRRVNGLVINPNNSYVRQVDDGPGNWEMITEQAGAQILSSAFPHSNLALQARAALIRSAMRGDGRSRWR